jgi:2-keto-3-deoxy-L-fuconate dehydrogenase
MPVTFGLEGKTAVVTGGASGIGAAICRLFSEAGARIVIADRDVDRGTQVASSLKNATAIAMDLMSEQEVESLFKSLDRLDVLVNSAGIGLVGSIEDTTPEDFERVMAINVTGVYRTTRHALPLLKASHGSIINIGSVAGLIGIQKRFAYCASKGAVVALTKQLAVEYPKEIRANCICPGTVDTPFVEGFLDKYYKDQKAEMRQQLNSRQPLGRLGQPDEIAAMALYLASDQSQFVNGSILTIDGGWTAA